MVHSQLQRARALELPTREAMLHRDPSVYQFWEENRHLLQDAWREWEEGRQEHLLPLGDSLIDPRLRDAVAQAWADPSKESAVRELWQEVVPGVLQCQLLDPQRLAGLRSYLSEVSRARIPLRPPYGIVLNRRGAMLDGRSQGFLAAPAFQAFYQELLDTYMRPIARLLFPEVAGYDTQSFGFSIQYQPDMDTSIRPHTDASAVTLNINLNLPGEAFSGSAVRFYGPSAGRSEELVFEPGVAVIHRGSVAHAALPITSGERSNLVLWLYGEHGRTPPRGAVPAAIDARQRWSVPSAAADGFAPF